MDSEGGPNHLGNMCDAPIFTLPDFSDVHVQPKYYYFGHISKYVPPGSVRVESKTIGELENSPGSSYERLLCRELRCREDGYYVSTKYAENSEDVYHVNNNYGVN